MKTILTIAGFDPSSGAGITADLAVFAAHRCYGISAITALTVQSTRGVQAVEAQTAHFLERTLAYLCEDLPPDGIKIGMLATVENVGVVAEFLGDLKGSGRQVPVVLDPVIRSSSGRELLSAEGLDLLREKVLPLATWVTPNLPELAILIGSPVTTVSDAERGAEVLRRSYPEVGVIVKGGHLADDQGADDLVLTPDGRHQQLSGIRIQSRSTHGTGCAFSSALICRLCEGLDDVKAAQAAKDYVAEAIRRAVPLGHGTGPMNLSWPFG